jgi:HlyD family secretion protein
VASGHVETPYRVEIASQITGTVDEVLVQEGQFVKRGEPLVILETRELRAGVVQAEGAVAQAEAKLRQIREVMHPAAQEALKQAKATLANAESYFERADQLARSGYGTRSSLDDATKNLDIARTQVRTAELQVYTSAPGGSDYVLAETQLSQAQANLATAHARMSFGTIVAPRDGTLISRSVERGTVVQPGRALMGLAPLGDLQLVLQVDEKNIGLLKLGQPALASADAYPDQRFTATVTYINPSVDISRASVLVKLTATDPPAYLRQDMTVSIDIEVERRPNTLIVPARTVHDANGASPWVLVVRDGRPRAQPVKLGLRAGERIEILDGVEQGELLVPLSAGVRAGQRIRPVPS